MKVIPTAITRLVAKQGLLASENAPKVLFVGGVAGMLGSTILACRATLKLETTLDRIESDKNQHTMIKETVDSPNYEGDRTYSDQEYRRDLAIISTRGVGSIAKLYAPSVILGGVSILALTKSHNILRDRNLALTAAYAAVDGAYKRYRARVIEKYGVEEDRALLYESETVDIVDEETGEVISSTQVTAAPGSRYARWYDDESSRNWSPHPDINMVFLRNMQNMMNDKLRNRGHVFLNEVYSELGLSHTREGSVVGWMWNKGSGDDIIDFGIWDGTNETADQFFNGREGAILLDFNVDGTIWNKIDEDENP